jgi:hypothetical protein
MISRTRFKPRVSTPACFILFRSFADAENLPPKERDIAHLDGAAAFEDDPIEIYIRVLTVNQLIAPSLDRPVDLLVQV